MNGEDLLSRVVSSIQEMHFKIGDSAGSVSLYYPFEGDFGNLEEEFRKAAGAGFPGIVLESLPQRLRVTVSEEDCRRMADMPCRGTLKDMAGLVGERADMTRIRSFLEERYPGARLVRSEYIDFDWILLFPGDVDDDVYCLAEEMGVVTYHRFSREEFLGFGFRIPE